MQHLGKWAAGIIGGALAIAVLFYAANATSAGTYNSALFVFVVLLVFVFAQIKRGFDQAYQSRHDAEDSSAESSGSGSGKGGGKAQAASGQGAAAKSANASAKKSSGSAASGSGASAGSSASGGGGKSASGKSSAAAGATRAGLSESAPSGPTNGTGAKH